MKTQVLVNKVSFDKLINLFIRRSEHLFILPASAGRGFVQIFDLEKGLQARFWDCCFKEGIEMYSDAGAEIENVYFTLAFFLDMQGLRFADKNIFLKENIVCDTFFLSAASNYKVCMAPMARSHCLSISFSKKWFENNVAQGNGEFLDLKEKICMTKSFLLRESMDQSEKKLVQDLFNASWKKPFGSFYIKSSVLKIISDFFSKIKERKTLKLNDSFFDTINKVEEYLNDHLSNTLPNLKDLAHQFSMSESTLKRHFKKKCGVNISTYFIHKKMEHAQHLIREKNMNVAEAASCLGYRNINHFAATFKKYQESGIEL